MVSFVQNIEINSINNESIIDSKAINPLIVNSLQNKPSSANPSQLTISGINPEGSLVQKKEAQQEIFKWLKSLSDYERFNIFKVENKWLTSVIMEMIWKQKENSIELFSMIANEYLKSTDLQYVFYFRTLNEHEFTKKNQKKKLEAERELIDNIKIVDSNELYDTLCFSENLFAKIDRIIEIFCLISDEQAFIYRSYIQNENKDVPPFPLWFNPKSFNSASAWIISHFEMSIVSSFLKSQENQRPNIFLSVPVELPLLRGQFNSMNILLRQQKLLDYWKSQDKSFRKKILEQVWDIYLKITNCQDMNEKHATSNELFQKAKRDWDLLLSKFFSKNRDKMGAALEEKLCREGFIKYSEEKNFEKFVSSLLFTDIREAALVDSLIKRKLYQIIKSSYLESEKNCMDDNFEATRNGIGAASGNNKKKKKKNKKKKNATQNPAVESIQQKQEVNLDQNLGTSKEVLSPVEKSKSQERVSSDEGEQDAETFIQKLIYNILDGITVPSPNHSEKDLQKKIKDEETLKKSDQKKFIEESETTRESRSITESEIPSVFEDMSIFDEMDEKKLRKKKKKKMKKNNKKSKKQQKSNGNSESREEDGENSITGGANREDNDDDDEEICEKIEENESSPDLQEEKKNEGQATIKEKSTPPLSDYQENLAGEKKNRLLAPQIKPALDFSSNEDDSDFIEVTKKIKEKTKKAEDPPTKEKLKKQNNQEKPTLEKPSNHQIPTENISIASSQVSGSSSVKGFYNNNERSTKPPTNTASESSQVTTSIKSKEQIPVENKKVPSAKPVALLQGTSSVSSHQQNLNTSLSSQKRINTIGNPPVTSEKQEKGQVDGTVETDVCIISELQDSDKSTNSTTMKGENSSHSKIQGAAASGSSSGGSNQLTSSKSQGSFLNSCSQEAQQSVHKSVSGNIACKKSTGNLCNAETSMDDQGNSGEIKYANPSAGPKSNPAGSSLSKPEKKLFLLKKSTVIERKKQKNERTLANSSQAQPQRIERSKIQPPKDTKNVTCKSTQTSISPQPSKENSQSLEESKDSLNDSKTVTISQKKPQALESTNRKGNYKIDSTGWVMSDFPGRTITEVPGNNLINRTKKASDIFFQKLKMDLVAFSDSLIKESSDLEPLREIAKKRLHYVVANLFRDKKVDIKIYGSCETGLSLPNSDMDMGITGFDNVQRQEIPKILLNIADDLSSLSWVTNYKTILTASIPVVKMEIDPYKSFNDFKYPKPSVDYISMDESYPSLNLKPGTQVTNAIVKVDITIENQSYYQGFLIKDNVGSRSTELLKKYLGIFPTLRRLTITLKYFLFKRKLNNSYEGGISSYCLILMIIAFLEDTASRGNQDIIDQFLGFLDYYGNKFNPKKTGISFNIIPRFFKINPNIEMGKLTIYEPVTNTKNMAQNAFLIEDIFKQFSEAEKSLKAYRDTIEAELSKLSDKTLERIDSIEDLIRFGGPISKQLSQNIINDVFINNSKYVDDEK